MVEMNLNASCKVSSRNNKVNHNSFQNVVKNWLWNGRLPRLLFWANPSLIFLWSAFTLNDWKVKTFMPIRHTSSMSRYLRSSSPMTFITKIVVQFMWFTDKSTMDHECPNIVKLITLQRRCCSQSRNSKYLMKLMLPLKHLKLFAKLQK